MNNHCCLSQEQLVIESYVSLLRSLILEFHFSISIRLYGGLNSLDKLSRFDTSTKSIKSKQ